MIEEEIRVAYRIDWREGILHFESRALASLSIKKSKTLDVSKARSFLYSFYFRVSRGGSLFL